MLLTLPQGQVSVYPCTGGPLIVWLLKLSLLIVLVFPLTKFQKLVLASCACSIGFFIGCIRVGLLAVVVNNRNAFDYWHGTQGGQIFLAAAILTFVVLCNWILPLEECIPNEQHEQSRGTPTIIKQKWRLPSLEQKCSRANCNRVPVMPDSLRIPTICPLLISTVVLVVKI